ncbi:MAG: beta-lactamase family protein [Cyclobacteriaceae bacterium]|nr:beta-lactamase family protein [Cyclobacteriaceae bacterium]
MRFENFFFKQLNLVVLIVTGLTCLSCGGQQHKTEAVNKLTITETFTAAQIDSLYRIIKFVPNSTHVAVAKIENGIVSYYGMVKERDTLTSEQNQNNFFEIGSITKVFTSTLLAEYIAAGKLNQQSTINQYVEFPFHNNLDFKFEELANHTSGLPRLPSNMKMVALLSPLNPYKNYDEEKLMEYLTQEMSLESEPGTKVSYSNLGVGLMAYTLQKYSGKNYEELVQEVFKKYGLKNSTTIRSKIEGSLIAGRNQAGGPALNWDMNALIGAGGIYCSVEELAQFALAQFDSAHTALKITRTQTFSESETRGVGLGWFILKRKTGVWYWHNGGTGGYSSSIIVDPDKRNAVIILSNISAFYNPQGLADKLSFALMKTLE